MLSIFSRRSVRKNQSANFFFKYPFWKAALHIRKRSYTALADGRQQDDIREDECCRISGGISAAGCAILFRRLLPIYCWRLPTDRSGPQTHGTFSLSLSIYIYIFLCFYILVLFLTSFSCALGRQFILNLHYTDLSR